MHVIVAGGGAVGDGVARGLLAEGHAVVVVEDSAARVEELRARGLSVVVGNATSTAVLEAAGALHAQVLIACVARDEDTLVIAALAKRHFDVARVVAVVRDDENRWLFNESWGVDVAVSPTPVLASLLEAASGSRAMVRMADLLDDHLVVVEVLVQADSPALGRRASQLALPPGDLVATVVRHGSAYALEDDTTFDVGDHVLVVAALADEALVRRAFVAQ